MPAELDILDLTTPFDRAAAGRAGWTRHEIERGLRSGLLVRLRSGVFVPASVYLPLDARGRHRLHVAAHLGRLRHPAVASHGSAALLLDLPLRWSVDRVELSSPTARPRRREGFVLHRSPLPDHHAVVDAQGVAVTTAARTVLDCARTQTYAHALVVADGALHAGIATREELKALADELARWPGAPRAARVVAQAAPAESPGETLLRIDLHALGFHDIAVQAVVAGTSGTPYRVDLLLLDLGVILEFDGAVKYGGLDGRPGTQALMAEKTREDDLRLAGWGVVRVVWAELGDLDRLRRKIEAASAMSRRARRAA